MADASTFTAETAAQHQAELNDYLQSKNINQLFIQIVESLLIEKPENPIGFIVEFLQKKYPDQAGIGALATAAAGAVGAAAADAGADSDDADSDSDDEDDYIDELPTVKTNSGKSGKRDSIFAAAPQGSLEDIKKVEKTAAETQRILTIISDVLFFKHLDDEQKGIVAGAMFAKDFSEGAEIITQGEVGDNFYIIESGTVDCFKSIDDEPEKKVYNYGPGGSFGELAIMYDAPRAATCRATSLVKVWAIDRTAFKIILTKTSELKRNKYKGFLGNVEILKQLNEYEVLTIADALMEEAAKDAQVLCRQGEPGDKFFIIKEGTISCTQADAQGRPVEVARLGPGDYFGEIALLTTKPRQATVTAVGDVALLHLDRKTFKRAMGPLDEVLKRNMAAYNKVKASQI